jgi:uncharacterized protein YecA (UPF0149 family)
MQVTQHPETLELRREFFTGQRDRDIYGAMDKRAAELGENVVHRTKIGRNTTCPCGSGRKFKKCCMEGARRIGTI